MLHFGKFLLILMWEGANIQPQIRPRKFTANPWHREQEIQNTDSHTTARSQLKQSNQLSLPQQVDFHLT